jgi:hypothetical protein
LITKGRAKKSKKPLPIPQPERFRQTAREIGTDENPATFERVFSKIVPPKHGSMRVATRIAKRSKDTR